MRIMVFSCVMLWAGFSHGQEAVVTLRSTVTGNQEQPKVMYIVPWQPPEYREFQYAPAARLTAARSALSVATPTQSGSTGTTTASCSTKPACTTTGA